MFIGIGTGTFGGSIATPSNINLLVVGQSLGVGLFNSQNGGNSDGIDELVSTANALHPDFIANTIDACDGGTYASSRSDDGTTTIAWWDDTLNQPATILNNSKTTVINSGLNPDAVLWVQGEADSHRMITGEFPSNRTTSAQLKASLMSIFNDFRSDYGNVPIFISGNPAARTAFNNTTGCFLIRKVYQEIIRENAWAHNAAEIYEQALFDSVHLDDYTESGRRDGLAITSVVKNDPSVQYTGTVISGVERENTNRLWIDFTHEKGQQFSIYTGGNVSLNPTGASQFIIHVNGVEVVADTYVLADERVRLNFPSSTFTSGDIIEVFNAYDALLTIDLTKVLVDNNGLPVRFAHWVGDFDNNWTDETQNMVNVYSGIKSVQLGDSLVSSQHWGTVTATALQSRATAYLPNMNAELFGVCDMPYISGGGASGATTSQIKAQVPSRVTYIQENEVDVAFMTAGTNDVRGSTPNSTLEADLISIWDDLLATGVIVVAMPPQPRDWSAETTENQNTYAVKLHAIRQMYIDYEAVDPTDRFYLGDGYDNMIDTSITARPSGLTYQPLDDMLVADGVHFSQNGAYVQGKATADVIRSIPVLWANPTEFPDVTEAINSNTNFSGTGGALSTATGVAADGIRLRRATGTTATVVGSKETATVFGIEQEDCQKIIFSGETSGTSEMYVELDYPYPTDTFALNDRITHELALRVEDVVGLESLHLYSGLKDADSVALTTRALQPISGTDAPDVDRDIMLRTEGLPMAAGEATQEQYLLRVVLDGTVPANRITLYLAHYQRYID